MCFIKRDTIINKKGVPRVKFVMILQSHCLKRLKFNVGS